MSTDALYSKEYNNLKSFVQRIRQDKDFVIQDRRRNLRNHKLCFQGSDAVNFCSKAFILLVVTQVSCFVFALQVKWLVKQGLANDNASAVAMGQRMLEYELLRHVLKERNFEDTRYFYRFADDERSLRKARLRQDMQSMANFDNTDSERGEEEEEDDEEDEDEQYTGKEERKEREDEAQDDLMHWLGQQEQAEETIDMLLGTGFASGVADLVPGL